MLEFNSGNRKKKVALPPPEPRRRGGPVCQGITELPLPRSRWPHFITWYYSDPPFKENSYWRGYFIEAMSESVDLNFISFLFVSLWIFFYFICILLRNEGCSQCIFLLAGSRKDYDNVQHKFPEAGFISVSSYQKCSIIQPLLKTLMVLTISVTRLGF